MAAVDSTLQEFAQARAKLIGRRLPAGENRPGLT
jgi:hypothetical protein